MKKKLLSLFLCSALLLSISTEQKAFCPCCYIPLVIGIYYGAVATLVVGACGLGYGTYRIFQKNYYNTDKLIEKSQKLMDNINTTYNLKADVNSFYDGSTLKQINTKNTPTSINRCISDCSRKLQTLSWYQEELKQKELQKPKKENIQLSSKIKQTLTEIEYTKSKMEQLYKTLTDRKNYLLLKEQVDFMSSKINNRQKLNRIDAKKLQRLQEKVDLDQYPGLKEKVRLVSIAA